MVSKAVEEFFGFCFSKCSNLMNNDRIYVILQWAPLHIAADRGHLQLCKYITGDFFE